jgi:hypothetical protein
MVDYTKSKIYKITCNITGLTYYGSTVNPISKRVNHHRCIFRTGNSECTSKQVLIGGDYDYSLVEEFSCENKDQLHKRERFYIENNDCVNKQIPSRTLKEYYKQNKDRIKAKNKEYWDQNRNELLETVKKYYKKNKDKFQHKSKEYYEENKDRILVNQKTKVTCECGSVVNKSSLVRHKRTKKHQAYLESQK